jgi:hypothetical protein
VFFGARANAQVLRLAQDDSRVGNGCSASNMALTILCRLRYRKDFGSRVVARLMVLASSLGNQRAVFFRSFIQSGEL